ncbi:MAG: YigZ family protein [Rhodanobacter sp.]
MSALLYTLTDACQHAVEIRKSRFVAMAAPVTSVEQAMGFLHDASDPAASHHCWAYRVGLAYRFTDDGEPGGSAGRPILQAIDGQEMDGVAVLVMRWFGGIKLGVGGLIRAYGGTAAECLRQAQRVPLIATALVALRCDFSDQARLRADLRTWDAVIEEETFDASGVHWCVRLPANYVAALQTRVADLSRGRDEVTLLN